MGQLFSGGTSRPAVSSDLDAYEHMRRQQEKQRVPLLQKGSNPHEYLFLALFDGTGQSADNPKQLLTNVGQLREQAKILKLGSNTRFDHHYVSGIGTQKNFIARAYDGAFPYTWDDRIEQMYRTLAQRARQWKQEDPEARISVIGVGYSRGAVLVPGLARLIDEFGIAHPEGLKFGRDRHGNITVKAPRILVPPGEVAQAVGLFDPVGTNLPKNYDARLPKSVLSGFSQIARDEQRELFPHQTILDPDWSDDGRFLAATVPGGHSNVGGGNQAAGLEVLAFNGMVDYLNALTDRPLFEHRRVLKDPAQYTIFQARGATAVYGLRMDDDGQRNLRDELANCKIVDICHDAEPVDRALARQFAWQFVTPVIPEPPARLPEPLAAEPLKPEPAQVNPYAAASLGREAGPASPPVLQFSDPLHPDHGLYQEARGLIHALDGQHGKSPDRYSDNLAAALVVAARANGLERVERLQFNDDASHVAAVQSPYGEPERHAEVPVIAAMNTPLQRSAERWPVAMEAFEQLARDRAQEQAMERERAQALPQQPWPGYPQHPASMQQGFASIAPPVGAIPVPGLQGDFDPRQLGPEKFALYSLLQERIPDAGPKRLLQFTAACHENDITAKNLDTIHLCEERLRITFMGNSWLSTPAVIDLNQLPPEPAHSLQQIREVDQLQWELDREHALWQQRSHGMER
jgi:hypothetical protein